MRAERPFHDRVAEVAQALPPPDPGRGAPTLVTLFQDHYDFVWRSLRRLGVEPGAVDDAAQEVFMVADRRLGAILPGRERAFLFGTALRIASEARRAARRRPSFESPPELVDPAPGPDELAEQRRARALLDQVLEALPFEVRAAFVLCELEGLTMAEVAECLNVPPGTVASRLRKGRQIFERAVGRLRAAEGRGKA